MITPDRSKLHKIVVMNPKGGSGKTTLATNIAGCYAMRGKTPTLVDCDPNGFSTRWLDKRPSDRPEIRGIAAFTDMAAGNAYLDTELETEEVIIDLPAGADFDELMHVTYDAGSILIPITPSDIDVFCASRFIANLLLVARFDRRDCQLAIVANRTRQNTKSLERLMRFLKSLEIPLISVLRDTQNYVTAAANGICIHELPSYQTRQDTAQMDAIIGWLDQWPSRRLHTGPSADSDRPVDTGVIPSTVHLSEFG